jgi:hypothetical protein
VLVLEGGKGESIISDMGSSLVTSPRCMPFSPAIAAFLRRIVSSTAQIPP